MSIFNPDDEKSNDNDNGNNIITAKKEEIYKLSLEIQEKTLKLNRLKNEIKTYEEDYKKVISTLKEQLSEIQDELIQKKADFETFNIKIENSFITEKDKKIKYLEENIKTLEDKYTEEIKENTKLKQDIEILKKENEKQLKVNEENELKIKGLEKQNLKMSTRLFYDENIIVAEKTKIKKLTEKNDEKNKINNDFNEIDKNSSINYELDEVDINDNINITTNNPIYSYECFNRDNLILDLREGTEEAEIQIQLRNNGNIDWNEDTKLKVIEPSDIKIDDIKLEPQKPNDVKYYTIQFKDLINLEIKEYTVLLVFCSEGKNYGDVIIIKINILGNNEFSRKKVDEFRKEYDLPFDTFSDEKILIQLMNNNFIFSDTYSSFYN